MIDQKIKNAVERARLLWALGMVGASLLATALVIQAVIPWWSVIFLIPIGVVTYFTVLTATLVYLTAVIKTKDVEELTQNKLIELEARLKEGTLSPGPELMNELEAAGLAGVIEPVELPADPIGTLNGQPIFEWVDHYNSATHQKDRFYFYGPATTEVDVPQVPGKLFINLKGILYVREKQDA